MDSGEGLLFDTVCKTDVSEQFFNLNGTFFTRIRSKVGVLYSFFAHCTCRMTACCSLGISGDSIVATMELVWDAVSPSVVFMGSLGV